MMSGKRAFPMSERSEVQIPRTGQINPLMQMARYRVAMLRGVDDVDNWPKGKNKIFW